MSTHVTNSVLVFAASDVEREAAEVRRVGGDKYVAIGYIKGVIVGKAEFPTIEGALAAADVHADAIDTTPTTPDEKITLSNTIKEKQAEIDRLNQIIFDLQNPKV